MTIEQHMPAPTELSGELHQRLAEAGQTLPDHEMPSFLLTVMSDDGQLMAGCKGEIAFTSARVSELWVAEALRGQGVGSKLLAKAEAVARSYDCTRIHIETRNELAKNLYQKLGFEIFGELSDYEGTNSMYYLEKTLV